MKRWLAAAVTAVSLAASPAQAEVAWQGEIVLASATPACQPFWKTGDFARVVFRPANDGDTITTNDADSYFSIFTLRSAFAHKVIGGQFVQGGTGDPYFGSGINSRGKAFNFQGGTYRNVVVTPSVITASTPIIKVSGVVTKFTSVVGCTVVFRAHLSKRPDL